MSVLVDTSIWSLVLRRREHDLSLPQRALVEEWNRLVKNEMVVLIGPVRQELLSGIRQESQFEALRRRLSAFDDLPVHTTDYERAAAFFNRCRSRGLTGSDIDLLICAVAHHNDLAVFTTDGDLVRCARHLPIRLHMP